MVLQRVLAPGECAGTGWQANSVGGYCAGSGDLPFMDMAKHPAEEIPFHLAMKQINETRRHSFDVDEEK